MINKERTQIKVGVFVFAVLVLAMYVIFMLGGEKQMFQRRYALNASFDDISGLRVGAPIQLAGLQVGYVDKIRFPKNLADKKIGIELKINKKYQARIRSDSTAKIETQGLLGDKFIFVTVGSEEQPVLNNGEVIQTVESTSIFDIAKKSSDIVNDVKDAADSAKKFFEGMYTSRADVGETLHSLKNIMKQAETGSGFIHALLYDPKGKEIVSDMADGIKSLKDLVGSTDDENKKTGQVSNILKNLKSASKDIKEIASRVNNGEGTIGGLLTDPSVYNDLRSLLGKANRNKLLKSVIRSTLAENDKKIEQ